jgi:ribosome production factor 2
MLKKPDAVWYKRKDTNVFRPFEDVTTLEFYSTKSDANLFAFGTHTKKRPDTLVLGRMYNYHLLDMIEFGVSNFKSLKDFVDAEKNAVGSKPCFILDGEAFQSNETMKVVGNLFVGALERYTCQTNPRFTESILTRLYPDRFLPRHCC